MTKRKILSYNIDEIKNKLIKFYFMDGGYFGGYDSIMLKKETDMVDFKFEHSYDDKKSKNYKISIKKWNDFINEIFRMNICQWKRKYEDIYVCDGEQWELVMEFIDLPKFKCYGSNDFPKNWNDFTNIITRYFPEMEYEVGI
jgi:hypothetical protein